MQFLFVIYYRRELFQIKSLTWILDRVLLVGDSKDEASKEVVFELPKSHVYDLCRRAARRQEETGLEQVLAVDLDSKTYTHSCADSVMQSTRSKLNPSVRIMVDLMS
jgi:hypothetical protein